MPVPPIAFYGVTRACETPVVRLPHQKRLSSRRKEQALRGPHIANSEPHPPRARLSSLAWSPTLNERIIHGDCVEVMAGMEECSVDAVCTDPPYGLHFMQKRWDDISQRRHRELGSGLQRRLASGLPDAIEGGNAAQAWHHRWATEALRVLKPGGHLAAMGGTRTVHRLMVALEDAGFEIRDTIQWQRLEDGYELVGVGELPPEEAFE